MLARKDLGQYFTPLPVVALCYELLLVLENWSAGRSVRPLVLDPACGDGVFLRYAVEHGFTFPDRLYGLDKDPLLPGQWEREGLTQRGLRLATGSALQQPDTACGIRLNHFDWVVGNPPYGGAAGTARVSAATEEMTPAETSRALQDPSSRLLEARFLRRFLDFARPGGHVAIIIPDGLLTNVRLAEFRRQLLAENRLDAVVSLPAHTFRNSGTTAKTSLVLFTKGRAGRRTPVFLTELREEAFTERLLTDAGELERVVAEFRQFCNWRRGQRTVFSGALLPLRLLPGSEAVAGARLDPAYYNPIYDEAARTLARHFETQPLGVYLTYTTYGQVGRREYIAVEAARDPELVADVVRHLSPANFACCRESGLVLGLQWSLRRRFVAPHSYNDPPRSRLQSGDLLLVNSGVACIGRPALFRGDCYPCTVSQHVNVLRLRGIDPAWLAVYLQTRFGRLQIDRECTGVGAAGINFARIKSIRVPTLPPAVQERIGRTYGIVQDHLALATPAAYIKAKGILTELVRSVERLLEIGPVRG